MNSNEQGYCIFGGCGKEATVTLQQPAHQHRAVRTLVGDCENHSTDSIFDTLTATYLKPYGEEAAH